MTSGFAEAVIVLLFFGFGIVTGFGVGERLAARLVTRREYVLANAATLLVGALAVALSCLTPGAVLIGLALGLMGGVVAGLKMGFGESVGPWKAHDRFFRVNKDHLRRSENGGQAEAARRARRDGGPEPELISVQQDAPSEPGSGGAGAKGAKGARGRRKK